MLKMLFSRRNRGTAFAASGGLMAVVIGGLLLIMSFAAGVAFLVLGIFFWALAGTADRWQSIALKMRGVNLEAKLAEKEHGKEFAEAAKEAPDSVLEAVLPLLREDVASAVLEVGPNHAGLRLIDPDLAWLRQELNVTVFAVQRPGDGESWTAGGRISALQLPAGTKLAVLGEQADIAVAAERVAR